MMKFCFDTIDKRRHPPKGEHSNTQGLGKVQVLGFGPSYLHLAYMFQIGKEMNIEISKSRMELDSIPSTGNGVIKHACDDDVEFFCFSSCRGRHCSVGVLCFE